MSRGRPKIPAHENSLNFAFLCFLDTIHSSPQRNKCTNSSCRISWLGQIHHRRFHRRHHGAYHRQPAPRFGPETPKLVERIQKQIHEPDRVSPGSDLDGSEQTKDTGRDRDDHNERGCQ